ncbi:class I glutamine amidotransferase-like protein [Mycena sp. CBHHK59/15]|nr:class I glutamine amidotransferase-like protein [Mycena sp. CBHHK59/15]
MSQILTLAVCVSKGVTLSDFVTPMEILAGINGVHGPSPGTDAAELPPFKVVFEYIAPTLDSIVSDAGPASATFNPTKMYGEIAASGQQFDILWVPAGPRPNSSSRVDLKEQINFIRAQAPKAKYILSVCTGAIQLAFVGVLSGKMATTNKALYNLILETAAAASVKDIEWVPKARWVVDGNVWTSSGATAGSDMALAFLEHLAGAPLAHQIRNMFEKQEVSGEDDPFATYYGLI